MSRRWLVTGTAAAVALLAACRSSTSSTSSGPSRSAAPDATRLAVFNPQGNSAGIAMPDVTAGEPWVYNLGYPLCTTGGPVRVAAVAPFRPAGALSVRDWSIGAPATTLGRPGTAADAVGGLHHPALTWRCDAEQLPRLGSLTVTVVLHSRRAQANGFVVQSDHGSAVVPFVVTACVASTCERDRDGP